MVPSETQGRFHTISVTPKSVDSSVPRGVLVHHVDQTWSDTVGYCVYQQACFLGSHHVEALVPSGAKEVHGRIDPILEPGDTMDVGPWTVSVELSHSDGFTVQITGKGISPPPATAATGSFTDVPADHTFLNAISALADAGITTGCNPPENTLFCPGDFVTRGQMAAFIARAAGLPAYDGPDRFTDDDGHTFEKAIERLAQAGITIGCNPPDNTRFCPNDRVTRGQMAALLVRALELPAYDGPDRFTDDDGHTFEKAIERLGQAGITIGCNPPDNTKFCPGGFVTRAQMAAFIIRAGMAG